MEILSLLSNLDAQIAGFIAAHGSLIYLLLFAIVFLEIGVFPLFFLPGNPLIFIAGSFCKLGSLNFAATAATLVGAVILGNLLTYKIGNVFGHKIAQSKSRWVNQNALNKTRNFYAKYGQATLMISPYIAVVRTFGPLLAGVSAMQFRKYVLSSSIGAVLWVFGLMLAGYFFSSVPFIRQHMASIVLAGLGIGFCFVIYGLIKAKLKPN